MMISGHVCSTFFFFKNVFVFYNNIQLVAVVLGPWTSHPANQTEP